MHSELEIFWKPHSPPDEVLLKRTTYVLEDYRNTLFFIRNVKKNVHFQKDLCKYISLITIGLYNPGCGAVSAKIIVAMQKYM